MTDPIPLNGRLTEILRGLPSPIAAEAFEPGYYRSCVTWEELVEKLAPIVAQAAEEHYRPRIETVEQLNALPFLTVIREVFRPSPGSGTDYGGIYERRTSGWQCLAGAWVEPHRNGDPKLPVVVLWPPGAGE